MKHFSCLIFFLTICFYSNAQQTPDTNATRKDTLAILKVTAPQKLHELLEDNIFLNRKTAPVSLAVSPRKNFDKDIFFYLLAGLVLAFGVAKAAYSKYFSNLFRVFFNSSLRQSQLTDQLLQDQLPSLIFNVLFVLSTGLYIYFLFQYYGFVHAIINWQVMVMCVIGVAIIYFIKFLVIRFTGWLTNYKQEAGIYTFIVFLINKIIGICLLPVIIILAFSENTIVNIFVIISFALIAILLFMRFFRSYSLLQTRIRVSRFHFLLYIFSVEVLPLLIIYKAASLFFGRKL